MNDVMMDKIAQAVLYEGYILYPYRPSVKSQHRWTFGGLFPQGYCESHATGDAWFSQTECIVLGSKDTQIECKARFLHLVDRRVGRLVDGKLEIVESMTIGEKKYQPWQEAIERQVIAGSQSLEAITNQPYLQEFEFPSSDSQEDILDENSQRVGSLIRRQESIRGTVEISAEQLQQGVYNLSVRACNRTPAIKGGSAAGALTGGIRVGKGIPPVGAPAALNITDAHATAVSGRQECLPHQKHSAREDALRQSFCSTHVALGVTDGQFVSLTDPPGHLERAVSRCNNIGVWPVLVGRPGVTDALLASPIILYDYPQIAPESLGDLFDGTEIDEILTLRVMTLTDEEKRDAAGIDPRADEMLKRTETLAREQLMNLHGTMRNPNPFADADIFPAWDVMSDKQVLPGICAGGVELHPGDRVRLRPRGGADAFDLLLNGMTATIAKIEQDFEDRIHLAVTVDDDPGADFGAAGKPGHRFFFRLEEVEPIT